MTEVDRDTQELRELFVFSKDDVIVERERIHDDPSGQGKDVLMYRLDRETIDFPQECVSSFSFMEHKEDSLPMLP